MIVFDDQIVGGLRQQGPAGERRAGREQYESSAASCAKLCTGSDQGGRCRFRQTISEMRPVKW